MTLTQVSVLTACALLIGGVLWLWFLHRSKKREVDVRELLFVVFVVGLSCRLAMAIVTPTFYAPDERSHFNYIRYLSENRSFPVQTTKTGDPENEWEYYQPPVYYVAMVPVYRLSEALFHDDEVVVRVIRLLSVVIWIGVVWLALKFLDALGVTSKILKTAVVGLVCLLPTYVFVSSVINNDNLVVLLGGFLLCAIARRDSSPGASLMVGVFLGLAMLTKVTAIVYVFVVVFASALMTLSHPKKRREEILHLFIVVSTAFVIYLPWAIRNSRLYGSVTAEAVANVPREWASMADAVGHSLRHLSESFWAVSGIFNNINHGFPIAGILLSCLALAGLFYTLSSRDRRSTVTTGRVDLTFLTTMALAIAVDAVLVLRFGILYGQGQGRFLFPLLFPIALFLGVGLRAYPLKNAHVHLAFFLITYTLAFVVFSLGMFSRVL